MKCSKAFGVAPIGLYKTGQTFTRTAVPETLTIIMPPLLPIYWFGTRKIVKSKLSWHNFWTTESFWVLLGTKSIVSELQKTLVTFIQPDIQNKYGFSELDIACIGYIRWVNQNWVPPLIDWKNILENYSIQGNGLKKILISLGKLLVSSVLARLPSSQFHW